MRAPILCIALLAGCGQVASSQPDAARDDDIDAAADPCAECDPHASCQADACVCDDGYQGDGLTCADVDECATGNGGCDVNATCTNTDGSRSCACNAGFEGDGLTCTPFIDEARRGCTILEAEHPGYTNIAGDVVLCGNEYSSANIDTACNSGWHVCRYSEWLTRYPTDRPYPAQPGDPDLIGPTLGPRTSWGIEQSTRCPGNVWNARAPTDATTWSGNVCHVAFDAGENVTGADYNPWNSGKYLYADDGATILQGRDANGNTNWGSWDVSFDTALNDTNFAVYCCRD